MFLFTFFFYSRVHYVTCLLKVVTMKFNILLEIIITWINLHGMQTGDGIKDDIFRGELDIKIPDKIYG